MTEVTGFRAPANAASLPSSHPASATLRITHHVNGRLAPADDFRSRKRLTASLRAVVTARVATACAVLSAALAGACSGRDAAYRPVAGGNADRGARALTAYGCNACHMIPGIAGAYGMVGPPLSSFAQRTYIAGEVTNTEENLIRWIKQPQAIEPGTAMPNLGVTDQDARDMAAYLYTLR